MSESARPSANNMGYGPVKTFAVRLNESTRAQLDIIAQLNDRTVTDEIRLALEAWIDRTKSDPATLQRADFVRAEIEREAATKRDAIAAIFDNAQALSKATPRRQDVWQLTRSGGGRWGRGHLSMYLSRRSPRSPIVVFSTPSDSCKYRSY
jgi:predicted transcriptional regulator